MSEKNRNIRKQIRFSQREYRRISESAKKSGMTFSAYIRYMAGREVVSDPKIKAELSHLSTEINYIGHNINQVVKNNNSGLYSDFDKIKLMEYMRIINEKVEYIKKNYGNK